MRKRDKDAYVLIARMTVALKYCESRGSEINLQELIITTENVGIDAQLLHCN